MSPPRRLFGTDGVRAPFGTPPLDRATVTALATALGHTLTESADRTAPKAESKTVPEVVLGGDTRASTPEICRWTAAGLAAAGVRTRYLGAVPTPAVAYLVPRLGAAAGVVVSASHNPLPDNGVKLLDATGSKWSTAAEAALEARLDGVNGAHGVNGANGDGAGPTGADTALVRDENAVHDYVDHLAASVPASPGGGLPLNGLHVALDAAHGAASPFARSLFERLGARVTAICDAPDGHNINLGCGSTHPERLAATVVEAGCDLGFAFDGDADRTVLVDETGTLRDGDAILYLWARALAEAGELTPPAVVATSMSNLGLEHALGAHGIGVVRCGVGDREVVETLRREGLVLGGEQSGHVVHLGLATTGDGLLTAAHVAAVCARRGVGTGDEQGAEHGRTVCELLAGFRRFPQVLTNVRVATKPELASLPAVARATRRVEEALGRDGRLVLRYSGTEPLARVMIEGPDQSHIERLAAELAAAIEQEIGAP